ncbi:MAG: hypothetical protein AMJ42_05980 [Deltaproteobacteria bacterium DG_8]|nr:MAG: hypothetical protein AMJ42_05980 [Deltaproteobacteria bacterium DG_8]
MEIIDEDLVEETWKEVAAFTTKLINKEMQNVGKEQPALLAFIVEFTEELDQEVKELAIYMFFNVYRMFKKGFGKKIKPISTDEIMECYESNENLMQSLEGAHDKFYDRIARIQVSGQPFIMKYVLETLFEPPEVEDSIELTDEDTGFLFLLLKTVVDILNNKTDA